jgi:hypothetical protein
MPVISALQRLGKEDHKFKESLGYIVRPCLKKKKNRKATPVILASWEAGNWEHQFKASRSKMFERPHLN